MTSLAHRRFAGPRLAKATKAEGLRAGPAPPKGPRLQVAPPPTVADFPEVRTPPPRNPLEPRGEAAAEGPGGGRSPSRRPHSGAMSPLHLDEIALAEPHPLERRRSSGSSTPGKSSGRSPKHVMLGNPGETIKHVVVFDASDPVMTLRHAPGHDLGVWTTASPRVTVSERLPWHAKHSTPLPDYYAQLMQLFDVSGAAGYSCSAAAKLLNDLQREWPHDYAVCFSQSTQCYWLLTRWPTPPNAMGALRAHEALARPPTPR